MAALHPASVQAASTGPGDLGITGGGRPPISNTGLRYRGGVAAVAIVNQKGGVGKTTVALGLASSAWSRRRPSLVIDLDPQGNATTGLGVWDPTAGADEALAGDRPGAVAELSIASGWPDGGGAPPRVVPATDALTAREAQLMGDPIGAQDRLRLALSGTGEPLVIIDCPPSLGLLTVNGLFAADRVLVVTEPGAWASDGVGRILAAVERVSARRPRPLAVTGEVVNRLGRTRDARYWYEQLQSDHGDLVLPPVRLRTALAEAAARGAPIHSLAPRPGAAEAAEELDRIYDLVVGPEDGHGP